MDYKPNLNHHRHAIAFDAIACLVGGDDAEFQGLARGWSVRMISVSNEVFTNIQGPSGMMRRVVNRHFTTVFS
jgi:hypothetical protein